MPRKVDSITKQDMIMLICDVAGAQRPDYASMHKIVSSAQEMLESNYGVTLGYAFKDPSVYGVWSNELQKDIERYDALSGTIEIRDDRIDISSVGEWLLRNSIGKQNLEKQFGSMEKLADELKRCL